MEFTRRLLGSFWNATELDWPDSINHPTVALFLLICDMSINPGSGFPFDPFPHFHSFIDDTIPGIRFTAMARMIRLKHPELFDAITSYSRKEYEDVSERISAMMLNISPMQIVAKCDGWAKGPMLSLMEEYRTYNYRAGNHVVRVLLSHFLAFSQDKLLTPEVFCWPGAWMAGEICRRESQIFSSATVHCLSIARQIVEFIHVSVRVRRGVTSEHVR